MKGEYVGYSAEQHAFIYKHTCKHCGRKFKSKVEDEEDPICHQCFSGADVMKKRREAIKYRKRKALPE